MRRRKARFGEMCDRLLRVNGGRITRGDLYAAFQEVANHEWLNGYQSCDWKWRQRVGAVA